MRSLLLIGVVVALGGCVEVYKGPRVVHYNPDWFYVRYAPTINGSGEVNRLAAAQCTDAKPVQLVESAQYYPYDLRVSSFRCQRPAASPLKPSTPALDLPSESETATPAPT